MAYVIISIIGIIAVLLVRPNWSHIRQISFVIVLLFVGMTVYFIIDSGSRSSNLNKGSSQVFMQLPWLEIGLYLVMLAGMVAKYIFDAIGNENKIVFQKWQFIKPLLVSPIVFGFIYSNLGEQSSPLLLLVFSFQNGFFWHSVLKK